MDTKIVYTKFTSLYDTAGERVESSWEEFKEILKYAEQTSETLAEYGIMTDKQRTKAKDVGGYVGGILERNSRERDTKVLCRYILVIDADKASMDDVDDFMALRDEMFFAHTTHSSTEKNPRMRWIIPLSRPVSSSEYVSLTRIVQSWIGNGDTGDDSTDEPKRLMFWPSCCSDSTYRFWEGGTVLLNPDQYIEAVDSPIDAPVPEKPKEEKADTPFRIPNGSRNSTLASHAGLLRNSGMDMDGILYALSDYNTRYCDEPLDDAEVLTIVRSICQYKPGDLVAFANRDAEFDFGDITDFSSVVKAKPKKLEFESIAHLVSRDIPEPKWIVKDLITTGITILASPPKFGKSWMVLDLCMSVGLGEPFLGMETTKADVIYMAMEDGDYRLSKRSKQVAGKDRKYPENVFLYKKPLTLKDGLLNYLQDAINENKHIGLIVIDTLQKIRGVAGKTEGVYGFDYREIGDIQAFALNNDIAVLLVHHTNKGQSTGDPVEKINGSTGLSGAADSYMILEKKSRNDPDTKLHITGRDVEQRILIIRFNKETHRWENFGEEKDVEQSNREMEFKNNPIVKYVLNKLEDVRISMEDEGEDFEDIISFEQKRTEMVDEINFIYGEETTNSIALGKFLDGNVRMFYDVLGITVTSKRDSKGKFCTFSCPSP